jgi:hypothetical protein
LLSCLVVGIGVVAVAACCFRVASLLGVIPVAVVAAYLTMVVALVGPAFLFERRGPLRRSSSLLHAAFWPTAGRLLLLGLTLAAGSFLENALGWLVIALDLDPQPTALLSIGATLTAAVVDVPLTMVLFSGILITYAERRGAEDTVSTARLVEELR